MNIIDLEQRLSDNKPYRIIIDISILDDKPEVDISIQGEELVEVWGDLAFGSLTAALITADEAARLGEF